MATSKLSHFISFSCRSVPGLFRTCVGHEVPLQLPRIFLFREISTVRPIVKKLKSNRLVWSACAVAALTAITGTLYVRRLDKSDERGNLFNVILPKIYAAKLLHNGDDGTNSKSKRFNFIADVVEKTAPAVVYIEIQGRHPFSGTPMTLSNGSGFIVCEDGLILTNAHVVANKSSVIVKLYDGRTFSGKVECVDPVTDLATIRINQNKLPTLKLGSSGNLRPGEWVVAMGNPLSLSNTITAGVISSVHRESSELGLHNKNMEYLQTDASITFGNSGGPLLNLDGEVIGINTMKVTAGISFAIPSDRAKEFLQSSAKMSKKDESKGWFGFHSSGDSAGAVKRRYMGITMLTLTPSIILELQQRQADFPRDVDSGVLIWKVVVGSPAYNGGLHPGDVVIRINDSVVKSASDVYKALETAPELRLVILRKQQKLVMTIIPQDAD